jgi:general secretion pathway protein B
MSFILDALRKSEIERQRQSGPSVAEFPVAREDRRLPIALLAIGLLLAVNVAVVLFFLLRDARDAAPAPAPLPGASLTNTAPTASSPAAVPAPAEVNVAPDTKPPADELAGAPVQLYGWSATEPPEAPDPTLIPDTPVSSPGVTYTEAPLSSVETFPAEGTAGLPALSVDLHIFADDPSKRAVFINGRRYVQGAKIAEGPIVEEITRDGAVLNHRGRRFLLPRL